MNLNLEELGLDPSLFQSIVDSPEIFERTGSRVTRVPVGQPTNYKLTINKKAFDAKIIAHDVSLSRLSLVRGTQKQTNREYHIVTGIFNPVKMDILLNIDEQDINIIDLLHKITKKAANNSDYSKEEFLNHLTNIRFPLHNGMPLFFQQMGASVDEYYKAVSVLTAAGGVTSTGSNDRIVHTCAMPKGINGVKVTSFEVGTTDPTQTGVYQFNNTEQGFVNFGETIFNQFTRLTSQRKAIAILSQQVEQEDLTQEQIKKMQAEIASIREMSIQWASNWSGSQQRWTDLRNGEFEKSNVYDAVNMPCGRFTLNIDDVNTPIDLWTNNATSNVTSSTSSIDAVVSKFTI
jgi:hypothetical protein